MTSAFQDLGDGFYRVGGSRRSAITGRYINDDLSDTAITCTGCGTQWNSAHAADRCCDGDDLTGYEPSRHHLSYTVGYD